MTHVSLVAYLIPLALTFFSPWQNRVHCWRCWW